MKNNRRKTNPGTGENDDQQKTILTICEAISEILTRLELDRPCLISISGLRASGVESKTISRAGNEDATVGDGKKASLKLLTKLCASHAAVSQECAIDLARDHKILPAAFRKEYSRLIGETDDEKP